jgi:Zn-dependent peptidase ImmA (M78 family)
MERFNPKRLDLARRRRGITKGELAVELGLSTSILRAYERGSKHPGPSSIERIAEVLDYPADFFGGPDLEEPPLDGTSFRAMSRLSARDRDRALAAGTLALALSDWIEARFKLPPPSVPRFEGLTPEMAAMAVRNEWEIGERPVKNMIHLLESRGVRVFSLSEECPDMDAFSFWRAETPYVLLNTLKTAEHSRMDAAHELGHLVMHWRGQVGHKDAEHEAQLFGSAFLMPRGDVIAETRPGARLNDIVNFKRRWNVSVAALTYRMHTLRLLTDWQYRALFMEISRLGFRHSEPNGSPGERSQILDKVFEMMRSDGLGQGAIAKELSIPLDELARAVFGLVLTEVRGSASEVASESSPASKAQLRVV